MFLERTLISHEEKRKRGNRTRDNGEERFIMLFVILMSIGILIQILLIPARSEAKNGSKMNVEVISNKLDTSNLKKGGKPLAVSSNWLKMKEVNKTSFKPHKRIPQHVILPNSDDNGEK